MNETFALWIYRAAAAFRGERTFSILSAYERSPFGSGAEVDDYHERKLAGVLEHIRTSVPHYRDLSPKTFEEVPILTKKMLKSEPHRFRDPGCGGKLTAKVTSGSTSEPLKVWKDAEAMACEQAATYRSYGWAGIRPGSRQARVWGVPLLAGDRRKNAIRDWLLNRERYSAFDYTPETLDRYARRLERQNPAYVYGYASVIAEMGRRFAATGRKPRLPRLLGIVTTAEILTPPMRASIEAGFGAKVFDEYGCAEVGSIAHDCEEGRHHINSENLFVEIVGDDGRLEREGEGRIILTELHNRAQPLVRYDSGDFGILTREPCPCGRPLPVLDKIHGRAYDTVIGEGGRRYNAAFFSYIFKEVQLDSEAIGQFQVVQEDRHITFRIVRGPDFAPDVEERLAAILDREFGEWFRASFEYVDEIERERSGKLRQLKRISPPDPDFS